MNIEHCQQRQRGNCQVEGCQGGTRDLQKIFLKNLNNLFQTTENFSSKVIVNSLVFQQVW